MVLVVLVCAVCVAEVEMRLQPQKELVRGLRIGLSLTSASSFSPIGSQGGPPHHTYPKKDKVCGFCFSV